MRQSGEHREWVGHQADDVAGKRIGSVIDVLVDPETDVVWLVLSLGRFTRRVTLVPATDAQPSGDRLELPIHRDWVREAPRALEPEAWRRGSFRSLLYRHYGLVGLPRRRGAAARSAPSEPAGERLSPPA